MSKTDRSFSTQSYNSLGGAENMEYSKIINNKNISKPPESPKSVEKKSRYTLVYSSARLYGKYYFHRFFYYVLNLDLLHSIHSYRENKMV